jgi:hypothetical protein
MKTLLKLLVLTFILNIGWAVETQAQQNKDNKLSKVEKKDGWILMFNGKNTKVLGSGLLRTGRCFARE